MYGIVRVLMRVRMALMMRMMMRMTMALMMMKAMPVERMIKAVSVQKTHFVRTERVHGIAHSFIIIREVLILTLSIFIAL